MAGGIGIGKQPAWTNPVIRGGYTTVGISKGATAHIAASWSDKLIVAPTPSPGNPGVGLFEGTLLQPYGFNGDPRGVFSISGGGGRVGSKKKTPIWTISQGFSKGDHLLFPSLFGLVSLCASESSRHPQGTCARNQPAPCFPRTAPCAVSFSGAQRRAVVAAFDLQIPLEQPYRTKYRAAAFHTRAARLSC